MRLTAKHISLAFVLALIFGWIFFLRAPGFGFAVWNVDEAIHAAAARTLLDGGVLYRDAIDQRTPLTYYAVAGLFALFGENNIWALHAATAALIGLTAFGVFLLGRRWRGRATGLWAAAIFCAFSTNLLYAGDAFAANTEWAVIFFTSWAAWWFWRSWERLSFWPAFLAGLGFGCAFLSKQPGLLDIGAPLATITYLYFKRRLTGSAAGTLALGLVAGFVTIAAATLAYFAAHGALADAYQYAWVYNLVYYGPEISLLERAVAYFAIIPMLWERFPVLLVIVGLTMATMVVRLAQLRPTAEEGHENPSAFFLLVWLGLALAGAAAGGRPYGHYYIQCFPPLALIAAWGIFELLAIWRGRRWPAWAAGALLLGVIWSVIVSPITGRSPAGLDPDPALRAAAFIEKHTTPEERIFVWGYNPDIYLFANRKPVSRFLYSSFLTGLIPWTNIAPGLDTRYGIVPGTMETLLAELEERRPTFIVDCSAGPHRHFAKYPLTLFPRLRDWIEARYVVAEPAQFVPQGFRLYLLKDSARHRAVALAGGPHRHSLSNPTIAGVTQVDPVPTEFALAGADGAGQLQRLELLVNGEVLDGVSFQPAASMTVRMRLPFDRLGAGHYQLAVRATAASGETVTGPAFAVECGAAALSAGPAAAFALPHLATTIEPAKVRAPHGATARVEEGRLVFFAHAPSVLSYDLPANAVHVRGRFGFRAGAWAPANPGPTDGAVFSVVLVRRDGSRSELFQRVLRPVEHPADRTEQGFSLELPIGSRGTLEFDISPGPAANAASDWTYWAELLLISSH